MGVLRILATLLVGFFIAWIAVALQHLAASGPIGKLAVVVVLAGFVFVVLLGFRLLV